LLRRVVVKVLESMLDPDDRIETPSVDAVLAAFEGGRPKSGYVANVQGNIAVSSNKQGVRIEPMAKFRTRRKRG
jgi:tRNA(Ile)-lysidine synthase